MLPTKPLPFGRLSRNIIDLWRKCFLKCFPLALLCVAITASPVLFMVELNTRQPMALLMTLEANIGGLLVFLLLALLTFSILYRRVWALAEQHQANWLEELKVSFRSLPKLVLATLIYSLNLLLGFSLAILPSLIIFVLLIPYFPLVMEGQGLRQAYRGSIAIVWGNWWRTGGLFVLFNAAFWLIALILDNLAEVLWSVTHPSGADIWLMHHLLRIVLNASFYPLLCSLLLLVVNDGRLRKQTQA